jgi:predicted Zn-dependent protease
LITSNQQLKNNLTKKYISEQRNCQDLLLLPKLSFDLDKSNFMPDILIEYLEKVYKRINENNLKIGKNDLEIPKGNFYFPLQNNFRVNL